MPTTKKRQVAIPKPGRTPHADKVNYSRANRAFTRDAAVEAARVLYPAAFGTAIEIRSMDGTADDHHRGIDVVVRVPCPHPFEGYAEITVQERFRRPEFAHFRDLTMSEWDYVYDEPAELYKIEADLIAVGYFDPEAAGEGWAPGGGGLGEAVLVETARMKTALAQNRLRARRRVHKAQNRSFVTVPFDALLRAGCVFHYRPAPTD